MADGTNVGLVVSIGSVIGTAIALLTFWSRVSDRITVADQKADNALQEAAETANDLRDFREMLGDMTRDLDARIEQLRREDGDSLAAIRQHVTDLAMFVRDNFVRNIEFTAAMTKLEAGQLRTETKIDRLFESMREFQYKK